MPQKSIPTDMSSFSVFRAAYILIHIFQIRSSATAVEHTMTKFYCFNKTKAMLLLNGIALLIAFTLNGPRPCLAQAENIEETDPKVPTKRKRLQSFDRTTRQRRPHEESILSEAGKRYWSSTNPDGTSLLPPLPNFSTQSISSIENPRSRNLSSSSLIKTGQDSFNTIGSSPLTEYGIGTDSDDPKNNRQSQQSSLQQLENLKEHPRNHNNNNKDSKKSAKGKGSSINVRPTRPPAFQPIQPPSQQQRPNRPPSNQPPSGETPPTGNGSGGGGGGGGVCRSPITMQFLQFSAIPPAILVFPQDPNVQDVGTRYIYNNDLRDAETLDELVGSKGMGVCTRIRARLQDTSGAVFHLGGGHCSMTYTMFDGSREFTMEASGTVVDSEGGTLSIVGGTKDTIGAFGAITLVSYIGAERRAEN